MLTTIYIHTHTNYIYVYNWFNLLKKASFTKIWFEQIFD